MVSLNLCAEFGRNQSKTAAVIVLTDTLECKGRIWTDYIFVLWGPRDEL